MTVSDIIQLLSLIAEVVFGVLGLVFLAKSIAKK